MDNTANDAYIRLVNIPQLRPEIKNELIDLLFDDENSNGAFIYFYGNDLLNNNKELPDRFIKRLKMGILIGDDDVLEVVHELTEEYGDKFTKYL